jgi:hypothetical protein
MWVCTRERKTEREREDYEPVVATTLLLVLHMFSRRKKKRRKKELLMLCRWFYDESGLVWNPCSTVTSSIHNHRVYKRITQTYTHTHARLKNKSIGFWQMISNFLCRVMHWLKTICRVEKVEDFVCGIMHNSSKSIVRYSLYLQSIWTWITVFCSVSVFFKKNQQDLFDV